jgi:hypothetical protein
MGRRAGMGRRALIGVRLRHFIGVGRRNLVGIWPRPFI